MIHHTNLSFKETLRDRDDYATNLIILHHTEVLEPHTVEDVHRWHQKKGMAGIGYHYFIRKDGEIYEGRPYDTIGAHAGEQFNPRSVGIAYEGDFNKEKMSAKQENAGVMLIALLSLAYEDAEITMYSDLKKTTDPGKNFPFSSLIKKVEDCKDALRTLFGDEHYLMIMDAESRNRYQGLDEEANRRRQEAPDLITTGNFDYLSIVRLFEEIHEECDY